MSKDYISLTPGDGDDEMTSKEAEPLLPIDFWFSTDDVTCILFLSCCVGGVRAEGDDVSGP